MPPPPAGASPNTCGRAVRSAPPPACVACKSGDAAGGIAPAVGCSSTLPARTWVGTWLKAQRADADSQSTFAPIQSEGTFTLSTKNTSVVDGTVDVVDIPFVAADGSDGRVELQIGWHSETVVISGAETDEPAFGEEPFEVDTILALQAKTRRLNARAEAARFSVDTDQVRRAEPDWDALI